ncbi:uncharacterized protein VTP21DRAFT_2134 [Calcarisporiella thermophila]|uniref:uncharacterized protein n=1 Tax=Calcarisporiella thermophila TaxID=911321 RepID=UPI00374313BC
MIRRLPTLSRLLHTQRRPNYSGWWTSILDQPDPIPFKPYAPISDPGSAHAASNSSSSSPPAAPSQDVDPKPAKEIVVDGIRLPPKPSPPDNCCFSGCAHCVFDIYIDELDHYFSVKRDLRSRLLAKSLPIPPELAEDEEEKANDVNGDGGVVGGKEMDPGMKAFLELERKLAGGG